MWASAVPLRFRPALWAWAPETWHAVQRNQVSPQHCKVILHFQFPCHFLSSYLEGKYDLVLTRFSFGWSYRLLEYRLLEYCKLFCGKHHEFSLSLFLPFRSSFLGSHLFPRAQWDPIYVFAGGYYGPKCRSPVTVREMCKLRFGGAQPHENTVYRAWIWICYRSFYNCPNISASSRKHRNENNKSCRYGVFQLAKDIHVICVTITAGLHTSPGDRQAGRQGVILDVALVLGEIPAASRMQGSFILFIYYFYFFFFCLRFTYVRITGET